MCTEHGWNLKKKKKSRLFIYNLIVGLCVYLVYWARFVSCLLQCLRLTLGLQFGPQSGQFGIQLGHDPHPADSQSCQRPKQKDDGHDEKNVQAAGSPAAVFLERLNIHFCILLSQKSTVRCLNFGKYLQILSKANQKVLKCKCKLWKLYSSRCFISSAYSSCCHTDQSASLSECHDCVAHGGFLYFTMYWVSDTEEKRGSHGFPYRLFTHAPLLRRLYGRWENETRRLSAALSAIAQCAPKDSVCGGKRKGESLHPHYIPTHCQTDVSLNTLTGAGKSGTVEIMMVWNLHLNLYFRKVL